MGATSFAALVLLAGTFLDAGTLSAQEMESEAVPESASETTAQPDGDAAEVDLDEDSGDQADEAQLIVVTARGGLGGLTETNVEQSDDLWSAGVSVRWHPDVTSRLIGELSFSGYERNILQRGVGHSGELPASPQDVIEVDGIVAYGYDLLSEYFAEGWIYLGWRLVAYENELYGENLTGAIVGGQARYPLNEELTIRASVDHTINLVSLSSIVDETGTSLTGRPLSSLRFGGGVTINPSDMFELGFSYAGEHRPNEFSDLLTHRLLVEAGFPFWF
jgi:hypothetical protein